MDYTAELRSIDEADRRAADVLEALFADVQRRLDRAEGLSSSVAELQDALRRDGEAILNEVAGPLKTKLREAADLGVIFTAASVTAVEIGFGQRTFVVVEDDRAAFAPAAMLAVTTNDNAAIGIFGRKTAYDRDTGQLVIDVIGAQGSGVYASWTITAGSRVAGAAQVAAEPPAGFTAGTAQTLIDELAAAIGNDPDFGAKTNAALSDRYTRAQVGALISARAPNTPALAALSVLPTGPDRLPIFTSALGARMQSLSSVVLDLLAVADASAARASIGAVSATELSAAIAALVGSVPGALDTLDELAAALGDDPNFAATVTTVLAGKQPLAETLTALAGLALAADRLPYATGAHAFATTPFTSFGRGLAGSADAVSARLALAMTAIQIELRTPASLLPRMTPAAARSALGATLEATAKWQGAVLGADGKVYSIPYNATDVLVADPTAASATRSAFGLTLSGTSKFIGGALSSGGKIYCAPFDSTDVMVIDTVAGTATRSSLGLAAMADSSKWAGAVLGPDGKIYCVPYNATDILIIDPVAGTAARSAMGAALAGTSKWMGGVLGADGKIYCIPYGATDILIIDPTAGAATRSAMGVSNMVGTAKWSGGALTSSGRIYAAPRDATDILIIDPAAGSATRSAMGAALSDAGKYAGVATGPDGRCYCAPYGAADALVIDPGAGTASRTTFGLSMSDATKWFGLVVAGNGQILAAPRNATDILVIGKFLANFRTAALMGAHLNKF